MNSVLLFSIPKRFHDAEHFLVGDKPPAVDELVAIDGLRQLTGGGSQLIVVVGELTALAARRLRRTLCHGDQQTARQRLRSSRS